MFIRLFVNTNKQDIAERVFDSIFDGFDENFKNKKIIKSEPYWKMSNMYLIEAEVEFLGNTKDENFIRFLDNIADKWSFYGDPVDEALASDTMEECKFVKNSIKMINIFY